MVDQPQLGPLGQVSRTVSDIAAAEAWYRDVLGLTHLYTYGTLSFFQCGALRLFLSQAEQPSPGESILYFTVDDIKGTAAALEARGVVFRDAPHRIHIHPDGTEEWMAFFDDPDGRLLALMAQMRPQKS